MALSFAGLKAERALELGIGDIKLLLVNYNNACHQLKINGNGLKAKIAGNAAILTPEEKSVVVKMNKAVDGINNIIDNNIALGNLSDIQETL